MFNGPVTFNGPVSINGPTDAGALLAVNGLAVNHGRRFVLQTCFNNVYCTAACPADFPYIITGGCACTLPLQAALANPFTLTDAGPVDAWQCGMSDAGSCSAVAICTAG